MRFGDQCRERWHIGLTQCQSLRDRILRSKLEVRTESFVPIDQESRALITYTNVDTVNFKLYRFPAENVSSLKDYNSDPELRSMVAELPVLREWQAVLPNEQDYQQHSTEIIVPTLPNGSYVITAAGTAGQAEFHGFHQLQVTDLAIVESRYNKKHLYQVVNRNTGRPIPGAKVRFKDKQAGTTVINDSQVTDDLGFVYQPGSDRGYQVAIEVQTPADSAYFESFYIGRFYSRPSSKRGLIARPYLFTDRSIYRPGQEVFFKGILIAHDGENSSLIKNEWVAVILYDANYQDIEELELKTNDFGSFSGSFRIPRNVLTGELTIEVEEGYEDSEFYDELDDFDYLEHIIQVEEYKRPRFETQFEPVKGAYQVNDSVTVTGLAESFAGSVISGAKVAYTVKREVRYPGWYYWSRPYRSGQSSQEVAQGELFTDDQGNYQITFKAIPDLSVEREDFPVFNYSIEADVTDVNGETRSASTRVKVGYHEYESNLILPTAFNPDLQNQTIPIRVNNLNGEPVDANVKIRFYSLKEQNRVLRKRPWKAPDYQTIPYEEFVRRFPHEPYANEDEKAEIDSLVMEVPFNTEDGNALQLGEMTVWPEGPYEVHLIVESDGVEQVLSKAKTKVKRPGTLEPSNEFMVFKTPKQSYLPGETIALTLGTGAADLTAMVFIQRSNKPTETRMVQLNREFKTLNIPVTAKDMGGIGLQFYAVNHNFFEKGTVPIEVAHQNKSLDIETVTFRDKLNTGQPETWSFRVKGGKGKKLTAEVLTSMYDASLDQFKEHNWSFDLSDYEPQQFRPYNSSRASQSFGVRDFRIRVNNPQGTFMPYQQYDRFNWYGFSFIGNTQVEKRYLDFIEWYVKPSPITSEQNDQLQGGYVTGQVTDELGLGLPQVTVLVKGTTTGTPTDSNGNYLLQAKAGDVLVFRYLGYGTKEVEIGGHNTINVVLEPETTSLGEVVVTAYGVTETKAALSYSVTNVTRNEVFENEAFAAVLQGRVQGVSISSSTSSVRIRGLSTLQAGDNPLIIVDGVPVTGKDIPVTSIAGMELLKDKAATAIYGNRAANGVLIITTKEGIKKKDEMLAQVNVRTNLKETAFFFPHLKTNRKGELSFNFTTPEALTRWKLQLFAHTKDLNTGLITKSTITQRELMVIPNPPRFLRQGDELIFSAKLVNLTDEPLEASTLLQLENAIDGTDVNEGFANLDNLKSITLPANGNVNVSCLLKIPEGVEAVQYKVVASAGNFSDGEQNVLPVLSNRMLVTETLPLWVNAGEERTFELKKLKEQKSETLSHHKLTLELTTNPSWYALQALPYLMEFPYECAEQTFSRYYANAIAEHVVGSNPQIKSVFENWRAQGALQSALEKNEDLKSILLQESPWVRDGQDETEQKKRIGLLFDQDLVLEQRISALRQLSEMQRGDGGFPWFEGGRYSNRYITQHILAGLAQLHKLGASKSPNQTKAIEDKAIPYIDRLLLRDYERLQISANKAERSKYLEAHRPSSIQLHYLYVRSFRPSIEFTEPVKNAADYYLGQAKKHWLELSLYNKILLAIVSHRKGDEAFAQQVMRSLKENAVFNEELGMYWKENVSGWYWHQSPIETQALAIMAFNEISSDAEAVNLLQVWLLKNKQTSRWKSTKATAEAVYAILMQGQDWLSIEEKAEVIVGGKALSTYLPEALPVEAGTGYLKTSWAAEEVRPELATVTLKQPDKGMAWGSMYWQYFEDLDNITSASTALQLDRSLYVKRNTSRGEVLEPLEEGVSLKPGDLVRVRIELRTDRDMEFLHLKDMRAAGFEPVNVLSGYKWKEGFGYYESTRDAATNFFIDYLPKGVYVFEYDLRVNNSGDFSNGVASIQNMYAPEFSSHSKGVRVKIER